MSYMYCTAQDTSHRPGYIPEPYMYSLTYHVDDVEPRMLDFPLPPEN
jgi:hypothetical protein